jgi:transcriptional antiterminator RfaH
MLLTAEQLYREQPSDAWFCVKTQTKREAIAAAELRKIPAVEVFCPQLRFRRATTRGAVWFQEAMFPSYLFARFAYAEVARRIIHANGVRGLVSFGERIALLGNEELVPLLQQCQARELIEIDDPVEPGSEVTVMEGTMHGLKAIVTRLVPGKERVCILLSILGRTMEAELPLDRVLRERSTASKIGAIM